MSQYPNDDEDMQSDDAPVYTPTTHHVAPFWKWLLIVGGPVLATLMGWAIAQILENYREGRGTHNLWLLLFVLAMLAGIVLLALAGMLLAWRARVVLAAEHMELRGLLGTRVITPAMMSGYRVNNGQLLLFLRGRQWPLNLAHFEQQRLLFAWISYYSPDLHAAELAEEAEALAQDRTLGDDEAQREARLGRLRSLTRSVNWLGYLAAVGGFVNAMFFGHEASRQLAIAVMLVLPALMLWLALSNPGHVRLDYKEGSPYPEVFTGWMACSLSLGLISLLEPHTLLGDAFRQWLLPQAALVSAVCIYIERKPLRALLARQWLHAVLAACSYVFIASFWVGGSLYQINQQFDRSAIRWGLTVVVGSRTESQKTGTAYYLKVAPWEGLSEGEIELTVTRSDYLSFGSGSPILLGVHSGALQMPWVGSVRTVQQ